MAKNVLNDFERNQVTVNWDELITCNTALCKYVVTSPVAMVTVATIVFQSKPTHCKCASLPPLGVSSVAFG